MELTPDQISEIASKLSGQLAAATAQAAPPGQPAGFAPVGLGVQAMGIHPVTLLLRIKIPLQSGEAGGYLGFALPANATAEAVAALARQAEMSFPIETYQPRQQRSWGNDGGQGRGGYRNSRRW